MTHAYNIGLDCTYNKNISYLTPKNFSLLYIVKTHVLQKCTLFTQFMSCKIIVTQVSYILIFSMNVPYQKGFGRGLSVERIIGMTKDLDEIYFLIKV